LRDLALRVALLDGAHDAAHRVDLRMYSQAAAST
jgi:hypothetical protein